VDGRVVSSDVVRGDDRDAPRPVCVLSAEGTECELCRRKIDILNTGCPG
jgi:hypothetical protein